jgi:hypothetical protein
MAEAMPFHNLLRSAQDCFLRTLRQLNQDEELLRVQVVLARFIYDAQLAALQGLRIAQDLIHLPALQRRRVVRILYTERKAIHIQ